MKALETKYRGINFRSRVEARWAIFMDEMKVKWIYEPEAYDLGDGLYYLPDFWLPGLKCFYEIKGDCPTHEEALKAMRLSAFTKHPVYIQFDFPTQPEGDPRSRESAYKYFPEGGEDHEYWWIQCPQCRKVGIGFLGWQRDLHCRCDVPEKNKSCISPELDRAYEIAQAERFWNPRAQA